MHAQNKRIEIIHSDHTFTDEIKYPEAIVALGNVMVEHEGATLQCKQALIYQKQNKIKAFGDVLINQGDTLTQTSKYVDYDGRTKVAKSWGNVILKDPKMTLTTDTLHFDRANQMLYYDDFATIDDKSNTLKSKIGKYFLSENKFQALSQVIITNPDNTVTSDHLDYFTDSGFTYLYGPSTIKDSVNTLYCENGFHNSKSKISHFTKKAKITYKDRIIEGDSMYYDENRKFASATKNITVTDTINNSVIKGQYAAYFEAKDSVYIVGKPYAITVVEKDSTYIHADTLMVTGKTEERIVRAFHRVKFYKTDLQGKCDSLYSNEKLGLTKMYRLPVLWNEDNQITGDSIFFTSDPVLDKIDSLKVFNNAFVINKDSMSGYNQIKGKFLYGKFIRDTLDNVFVNGNSQMIQYLRDEKDELIGIAKMTCSNMTFQMQKGELSAISYLIKPEGKTYPPSQFPEEEALLKGFLWRQEERPLQPLDIFEYDEGDEELIQKIKESERNARIDRRKTAEHVARSIEAQRDLENDLENDSNQVKKESEEKDIESKSKQTPTEFNTNPSVEKNK